jgi:hypothetical protein
LTFGEGDFVLVLYQLGLVGWGLVLLFGNLWKSNADTAYAFGVAGAELFNRPSKAPFVGLAWLSGELEIGIPPVIGILVAVALSVGLSRLSPDRRRSAEIVG